MGDASLVLHLHGGSAVPSSGHRGDLPGAQDESHFLPPARVTLFSSTIYSPLWLSDRPVSQQAYLFLVDP